MSFLLCANRYNRISAKLKVKKAELERRLRVQSSVERCLNSEALLASSCLLGA